MLNSRNEWGHRILMEVSMLFRWETLSRWKVAVHRTRRVIGLSNLKIQQEVAQYTVKEDTAQQQPWSR